MPPDGGRVNHPQSTPITQHLSMLPSEIWLEIFNRLPLESIPSIFMTNRTFSVLARPLRFSHFNFMPFTSSLLEYHIPTPAEPERLEFWCSERIAPLVRSCPIRPWLPFPMRLNNATEDNSNAAFGLLTTFLSKIEWFERLESLELVDAPLTDPEFRKIFYCLPSLRTLQIEHISGPLPSEAAVSQALPLAQLRNFSLTSDYSYPNGGDDLAPYLPLLNPSTLRRLTLCCTLPAGDTTLDSIATFPQITHLSIAAKNDTCFSALLRKCSNIQELHVIGDVDAAQAADVVNGFGATLACVKKLSTVSRQLMEAFIRRATQLRILLCNYSYSWRTEREPFFSFILSHRLQSASLSLLDVHVGLVRPDGFQLLMNSFPALKHLALRAMPHMDETTPDGHSVAVVYLEELASIPATLTPTLQTLFLTWPSSRRGHLQVPGLTVENLRATLQSITQRYPTLNALGVDAGSFVFRWERNQIWGLQEEYGIDQDDGELPRKLHIRDRLNNMWEDIEAEELKSEEST
ncbi:hypothetical protein MIND_01376400 [Mycena indigotica]|uniref:F-box domain-containing protein n=1 Tax=Mycena indigotica TaxID=2126181 RepID=A0A8H6VPR2_9AGAR|nr:uncharacterized protein MIND_01376400 [Mycena indigotica]KAF7289154.1 hypothetical protein MIND_01376400 [Mycena indigotica]